MLYINKPVLVITKVAGEGIVIKYESQSIIGSLLLQSHWHDSCNMTCPPFISRYHNKQMPRSLGADLSPIKSATPGSFRIITVNLRRLKTGFEFTIVASNRNLERKG